MKKFLKIVAIVAGGFIAVVKAYADRAINALKDELARVGYENNC